MNQAVVALYLLVLTALSAVGTAYVCPQYTCAEAPTLWLNSSSMAASIHALKLSIFPVQPNGTLFSSAFASANFAHVAEMFPYENVTSGHRECTAHNSELTLDASISDGLVASYIDIASACCNLYYTTAWLSPTVFAKQIVSNITVPDYPDFFLVATTSMPNGTYVIEKPASPTSGDPYNITYNKGAVKFDVVLNNWPWMLFETSNSSYNDTYLAYFFDTDTELDTDGLIHVWDADRETHVLAQSKLATIKMDFLKLYTVDGTDYFSSENNFPFTIDFPSMHSFPFPGVFKICGADWHTISERFQQVYWDPSLEALFTPPPDSIGQKPLNPAAYAVPIAVLGVALAVAAVGVFVINPMIKARNLQHFKVDAAKEAANSASTTGSSPPTLASTSSSAPASQWSVGAKPASV